jgi:hypothetical protein
MEIFLRAIRILDWIGTLTHCDEAYGILLTTVIWGKHYKEILYDK